MRDEFNAEEYFSCVPVITYKKILELLKDQTNQKIIIFCSYKDFTTNKTYQLVRVRYICPEKEEQYLSPDQTVDEIDINLHNVLKKSDLNPTYRTTCDYVCSYIAVVGINYVDFPRQIADRKYQEELDNQNNEAPVRTRFMPPVKSDIEDDNELPFHI